MGRIIEVVQNSDGWRIWRDKGLGASDAPVVMGDSPWTTPFELWAYKTGLLVKPEANEYQKRAMQRGQDLEPVVRQRFEKLVGESYPATSFEHDDYPFLRASLDGYCAKTNTNLEIKCPGKIDHKKAVDGLVPSKYYSQVQMQMLVSGAKRTEYVSWDGKGELVRIGVEPDLQYQDELLKKMTEFWRSVQSLTPPPMTSKDILQLLNEIVYPSKMALMACQGLNKGEKG